MKKICLLIAAFVICCSLSAQETRYFNAADLTVIGKPIPTSKDFTRIDTSAYKFNDKVIDEYACHSTGLAVLFATDSPLIKARWVTSEKNASENMTAIAQKGLDLYIKKDGEWVFAGVGRPEMADGPEYDRHEGTIVKSMAPGRKECLMYLPLYDRLDSLFIGVEEGSYVEPLENPFKYRIVVKGSSVTHGLAASRPGMSYAARFGRDNGFYCFNLGFSGKSKLQEEYAKYLADIEDVDAFVFDAFSNPSAEIMEERLFAFIEQIQKAHPDIPLIFQQTIYRERRNFNQTVEKNETKKQKKAEELMKEACKRYKNVYFIQPNAADALHETSVDSIHPGNHGYTLWARSIEKPLLKILRKYGIK